MTIFTSTNTGIVLNDPTTQNPSTVASGATITNTTTLNSGDAVYGSNAAAWDFTNLGIINATYAGSHGIRLMAGGTITNSGMISGGTDVVFVDAAAGTVANYGTIVGTSGAAIWLNGGGLVTNSSSGLISGTGDVIFANNGLGTVVNDGTIENTGGSGDGVCLDAGGTVINSGAIQGHDHGVEINGAVGTVTNSGIVSGVSDGIDIASAVGSVANLGTIEGTNGSGVYLGAGGSITNGRTDATSASISGFDTAIRIEHSAGTVANFGTITATSTAGYPGGVALLGGGNVTNMLSGVIDGHGFGVGIGATGGTLTNFGVIRATGTGFLSGVGLGADGSVINSGTISALGGTGVAVSLNYGGSVLNASGGLLEGSDRGVAIGGTSPVAARVTNSGTITGGSDGIVLGVADAAVTNSGTILGTARYGVFLTSGGVVTNASTGLIEGYKGVIATAGAATVTNLGTITGGGSNAVGVDLAAAGSSLTNAGMVTGVSRGAAFTSGGYLYNEAAGTISGNPAVFGGSGAVTIRNLGVINGGYRAIELNGGGSVTNGQSGGAAATVVGDNGAVLIDGGVGTVVNFGTIAAIGTGASPTGVYLFAGTVINGGPGSTAALIAGTYYGLQIYGGFGTAVTSGTVVNYGTIETTSTYGGTAVILRAAGNVINHGAIINDHNGWGVYLGRAGSTLTNTGTIVGERYAVDLEGANSRVIAEPGAVFSGKVYGGTVGNTLELAAGVGAGTLGGIGASTGFVGFGTVVVDASATWLLSGTNEIDAGTTLTNAGTIDVGGTLTLDGSVGNGGVIDIEPGGRLILATTITGAGGVAFAGSGGTFEIDAATMPTTPISGVTAGDQIDLRSLAWVSSSSAVFSGGTLTVIGGGGVTDTLTLSGFNSSTTRFNTADDGFGGTVVTAMAIDDDAVIDLAGVYLVTINTAQSVNSLTLSDAGATVTLTSTLAIGTTVNRSAGIFNLNSGGVISGGTVTGSGMVFQGGTLSGVNYQGTLDLSAGSSRLHVTNGITLSGAGGSGPATVLLTGDIGRLYFSGTESFDNAAVSIGNGGNRPFLEETGSGGTLSLGPNLAITQTGFRAEISAASGSTIVNSGTIAAGVSGGYLAISGPGTFINQGTIGVSNGDDLEIRSGVGFSNQGTLSLTGGGVLHLRNSLATADLGVITNPSGTVFIDNALNNAASVLATGSAGIGAVALTSLGVISGGTVTGSGMVFQGGTLSGVNYQVRWTPNRETAGAVF